MGTCQVCAGAHGSQRKASASLELEFQVVVCYLMWIQGIELESHGRRGSVLNLSSIFSPLPDALNHLWIMSRPQSSVTAYKSLQCLEINDKETDLCMLNRDTVEEMVPVNLQLVGSSRAEPTHAEDPLYIS